MKSFCTLFANLNSKMEENDITTFLNRVPIVVRYIISGGSAAVLNIGTLFVLTHFFGVWYLISSVVAFLVGFLVSFTLQRTWTFDLRTADGLARHTSLYFVVALGNTFLNTVLVFCLVEYMHVWYVAAQIIAGLLIAVTSFFVYKRIFS